MHHTCVWELWTPAELPRLCPWLTVPQFPSAHRRESPALPLSCRDEGQAVGARHCSSLLRFLKVLRYVSHLTAKSLKDAHGICSRQLLKSSSCFPFGSSGPVLRLFTTRLLEVQE